MPSSESKTDDPPAERELTADEIDALEIGSDASDDLEGGGDPNSLLSRVQTFCMSSAFEHQFEDFAAEHCDLFIPFIDAPPGTEHSLEFHDCFQEYLGTFEGKIVKFIEGIDLGADVGEGGSGKAKAEDFFEECRLALENLPAFHPQRFFIEALLATTEYPIFFTLMIGEARNRRNMREQEKAKEEGKEGDEEEEGTGSRK